jgi:deoxyribonuclease-4
MGSLEFGSHVSASGGVDLSLPRAAALEMTACQIFTKNERQWNAKPLDPAVIERFKANWQETGLKQVVAHDSYLINVASPDEALWARSKAALMHELERCDQLGVPYLVSHPGAHVGSGIEAGVERVAKAINEIHRETPEGRAIVLIETTAGQGTALGRTFEEIAAIIAQLEDKSRIGVCLDTCHIFAAGYDIRDQTSYDETMAKFDETIGLDRLKCVHLNDSQKGLGSRVDRHAHIGQGEIGAAGFGFIVNDPRLAGLPGILETPKENGDEEDKMNLATLRGLIDA